MGVTHPDDVTDALRRDASPPADGRAFWGERRFHRGDGRVIWVTLAASRLPTARGRPPNLVVHVTDVTERRQREAELHHRALHDPLTGLANRALLLDRITVALAHLGRHARPSHLFLLDLDGFKPVNDRHGHAAGDAVLVQLAARLTALTRVGDTPPGWAVTSSQCSARTRHHASPTPSPRDSARPPRNPSTSTERR